MAEEDTPAAPALDYSQLPALMEKYGLTPPAPPQLPSSPGQGGLAGFLGDVGKAFAGGGSGLLDLPPGESDRAGAHALLRMGTNMLMASGPSYVPRGLGEIIGYGLQGAQEGYQGSELAVAQRLAAQQAGQQQSFENRMAAIKAALPILMQSRQLGLLGSLPPIGGGGGKPGTSISDYANGIAGIEGTGKNPNSTAFGHGQFLESTWNDFAAANPDLFKGMSPAQVLAARGDPAIATKAINWLAQKNADDLTKNGVTPSGQSLGIAHYVGSGPAAKIMAAPDNAPVAGFVGAAAVKANPELATMTAGQMKQRYASLPAPGFLSAQPSQTAAAPPAAPPGGVLARPGVQVGGEPPPPPGGSGAAYTGGIGAALRPPASAPVATVPPPPVVSTSPTLRGPGSPVPPASRKVADIIQEGMDAAQTGPAAPTALTAGPGAPTAPAPDAGWGTTVGNYGSGAAQPPTTMGTTTPPPGASTTTKGPTLPDGTPISVDEYRAGLPAVELPQHLKNEVAAAGQLTPEQTAAVEAARRAALISTKDPGKAAEEAYTKQAEFLQQNRDKANADVNTFYKDTAAQQAAVHQKLMDNAQAITLEHIKAGTTLEQAQQKANMDIASSDIQARQADAREAAGIIPILKQIQSVQGDLPKGLTGFLLGKYDPTGEIATALANMGWITGNEATKAQLLQAARNYLSIRLKPTGTGALRVPEMENLKSFTPGQLSTPQAQQEMTARLIAYQQRSQDEADFAGQYFGRTDPQTGKQIFDNRGLNTAMRAPVQYDQNGVVKVGPDGRPVGGLGPVVPEPPPVSAPDSEHQAYKNYVRRNVQPGMPYQTWEPKTDANGSVMRDANGKAIPVRVTRVQGYD